MAAKRLQLPTCLTIHQVADQLGVSDKTVRRWVWDGELRHHRLGSSIRISEEDLAAFLAARRR